MRDVIELVEYETATVELSHAEAAELAELTRGVSGTRGRPRVIERLSPAATAGTYRIQPGPFVGRFQLRSGRVVDVAGRFPFQNLVTLLGLATSTTMVYDAAASASGRPGLMDLVATAYVREAERVAGQGLLKAYQRRTFARPPYPGTPAATVHLRTHAGRPDRLATTASRLTVDIPLNRLVATAHRRLSALSYRDDRLTARLRALAPVFHRIGGAGAEAVDAVPARYRELHRLCRLVLDEQTTLPTGAGVAGVSVLFNMTKIWERYVGSWLQRRVPGDVVRAQHVIPLTDSGAPVSGTADFVVHRAGRPVAVYDAKYRKWRERPTTDEIYQLFTYAHRLGVTAAALVYPGPELRHHELTVGNVTIGSWAIPVA